MTSFLCTNCGTCGTFSFVVIFTLSYYSCFFYSQLCAYRRDGEILWVITYCVLPSDPDNPQVADMISDSGHIPLLGPLLTKMPPLRVSYVLVTVGVRSLLFTEKLWEGYTI